MDLGNLLTPWFLLAAVLIPLALAEKWIHSHLYGVGWLLTNENQTATLLYYLILLPGVFLHEFIQWLLAYALNAKTKPARVRPQVQEDGTLRLDFVQLDKVGWIKSAIIGAAPLLVGTAIIGYISNNILDFEEFLSALGTGDVRLIGPAVQELGRKPDFYLWLYLMFAISNAMLPTPQDRKGWPLLIGLFGLVILFLVVIGVGDVLMETFTGPVAHGLNLVTTAFTTVLVVEVGAILVIGLFEEVLEYKTKRKMVYSTAVAAQQTARQPGSSDPLPPGAPRPSIYNLTLPVPEPSRANTMVPAKQIETTLRPAISSRPQPGETIPRPASALRTPITTPTDEDSEIETGERRPITPSRPDDPLARPASAFRTPITPRADDDEDDAEPGERRPLTPSRPGDPLARPTSAFRTPITPRADDDEDDAGPGERRPITPSRPLPGGQQARPTSTFRSPMMDRTGDSAFTKRPSPFDMDDDEDIEDDDFEDDDLDDEDELEYSDLDDEI